MRHLIIAITTIALLALAVIPPLSTAAAKPECFGKVATIVGNKKANTIKGTRGNDVIVAKGGNDKIFGRGGKDRICAGGGRDIVKGGAGRDWLDGGNGDDDLHGQRGLDRIYGAEGDDDLFGGKGNDILWGNGGNDDLDGGPGKDVCRQFEGTGSKINCEDATVEVDITGPESGGTYEDLRYDGEVYNPSPFSIAIDSFSFEAYLKHPTCTIVDGASKSDAYIEMAPFERRDFYMVVVCEFSHIGQVHAWIEAVVRADNQDYDEVFTDIL
jgi:hypothetical protein